MTSRRRPQDVRRFTKVYNDLFENPKIAAFERRDLHTVAAVAVAGWMVSNDTTADGEIIARSALRKADAEGIKVELDGQEMSVTDALVAVGLWHRPGHDCDRCQQPRIGRVQLHDIGLHQPSKADREALSAERAKNGKKGAESRWAAHRAAKAAKAAEQGELPLDGNRRPDVVANGMAPAMANGMASAMARASEQLDSVPEIPTRRPRATSNTGRTKIREDFEISDDMRSWAKEHTPDVDTDTDTARFVRYWRGRGTVMQDWKAQWESWMLGEQKKFTEAASRRAARGPYRNPAGGAAELRDDWDKTA